MVVHGIASVNTNLLRKGLRLRDKTLEEGRVGGARAPVRRLFYIDPELSITAVVGLEEADSLLHLTGRVARRVVWEHVDINGGEASGPGSGDLVMSE